MNNIKTDNNFDVTKQIRFVSHEIRNHISVCDMYAQILKKHIDNDGYKNPSVENALECIQKSLQIISMNVADLKSININNQSVLDFKTCIEKAVELSKAYVEDKDIEFEIFIKNTSMIKIDENRLTSCIVNIIKNAIEAIEIKGKICVFGEIKDNYGVLKISNNGKQIPNDKQDKIFDYGYTSKQSGSGYGLHICKKYLNSQNADIELVKSNKAETLFKIMIPLA
ncbi:HAMP domain-containing histidine kinase [bacterium]|nr:HAMP domain-containing histidine kinase [bacterium]